MSQRTMNWPRRIARVERTSLSLGHGSFCLQRVHLGDDAFDRQRIGLTGYLLVFAREGSVILDRDQDSFLLQEGDAALIPPGEFQVTEIPRPRSTRGVTAFYFFNPRALADLIRNREGIDELAVRISLPAAPFYPVQRLGDVLHASTAVGSFDATDLGAVFTALLAARPLMVCTFLKHAVFVPRLRLCLFLDAQCMGKVDLRRIAASYPEGATAFRRHCATFLNLPVEQWFFRRRIELARYWLRYTDRGEGEVAALLGYKNLRRFRGDLKRFDHFSPLELKILRRFGRQDVDRQAGLPSWFPGQGARAARGRRNARDMITLTLSARTESAQRALLRKYSDEAKPTWTPSDICHATPARAAEDAADDDQETLPNNVITWERVEKWRTGEGSLELEPALSALAA